MGNRKNKKTKTLPKGLVLRGKTYWINYSMNGQSYCQSSKTEDLDIAKEILEKLHAKIALDKWHPEEVKAKEVSFDELCEEFGVYAVGRIKSWDRSFSSIVRQLQKQFKDYLLSDFSTKGVEQYQSALIAQGLAVATINKRLMVLKLLIAKAVAWKMCPRELLLDVRDVKTLGGANKRLRFLSKVEQDALIEACDAHVKPIVQTALATGMRKGEILGLKWDKVDLRHNLIFLDTSKNGERREVPVSDSLKAILQSITRHITIPYVFHDGKGRYGDVKKSWHSALLRAEVHGYSKCDYQSSVQNSGTCPLCNSEILTRKGIKDFKFHDLRHTFASHLVMAGIDLATVAALLGHKDIKMTLRYAHLAPSHKKNALQKLDAYYTEKEAIPDPNSCKIYTSEKVELTANAKNS